MRCPGLLSDALSVLTSLALPQANSYNVKKDDLPQSQEAWISGQPLTAY